MEEIGAQPGKEKQILAAARRIFAASGYYQARVEDIAREAGIGKGTVYEYFTSKEELYLEMLLEIADSYVSGLAEVLGQPGTSGRSSWVLAGTCGIFCWSTDSWPGCSCRIRGPSTASCRSTSLEYAGIRCSR